MELGSNTNPQGGSAVKRAFCLAQCSAAFHVCPPSSVATPFVGLGPVQFGDDVATLPLTCPVRPIWGMECMSML